jgi:hypothetical protein
LREVTSTKQYEFATQVHAGRDIADTVAAKGSRMIARAQRQSYMYGGAADKEPFLKSNASN